MPTNQDGLWTTKLSTGRVSDIEDALGQILTLQAERVLEMMEGSPPSGKNGDEPSASAVQKYQERIDKNLDKLYKNAMAYRNAKAPRANAARGGVIDQDGLPTGPTPNQLAQAIAELTAAGVPRENLTREAALAHLRDQGQLALPQGDDDGVF